MHRLHVRPSRSVSPAAPGGYSLVEVMVVLTVMSVLVAMSVPSYQRTLEQARADVAVANLRAIWSAERLYWLEYHAYTSDLAQLQSLGLIDPAIVLSTTGYVYTVISAGTDSLQVVAVRSGNPYWNGQFSLDQTGAISGSVASSGGITITPGFQ